MRVSRTLRLMAAGLVAVLVLGACSGSAGDPSPSASFSETPTASPSHTLSASPTATPSPSPSTDRERAATGAVLAYIRVVDKLGIDPSADINELATVATGDAHAQMLYILLNYRKDGWQQVGEAVPEFRSAVPGGSDLEWTVTMCVDVRAVDVLDAEGNSVKNPDGPARILIDYTAAESLAAGQWYVAKETAIEPC